MIPIYTFVTDPDGYREMRRSFEEAGFTEGHASFTRLEGRGEAAAEPYSTLSELISATSEPYFILCHQDVRLDQRDGIEELRGALAALEAHDEHWAVAGNAGGSRALRVVRHIVDPHGGSSGDPLPARVHSLDENFLVVRSRTGITCSPGLAGFHLYGSDLCLNALKQGRRAYVIDFLLRHTSPGTKDAAYETARDRFVAYWSAAHRACYFRTTSEVLFLSRWQPVRGVFGHPRIRKVMKNHPSVAAVGSVLAPR